MSANDIVVLDSILSQRHQDGYEKLPDDEFFEFFTFDQLLKDYDLADEEIFSCSVDGGDDGGIDGFFIFINGDLLCEDSDLDAIKRNPDMEVYLIQSKKTASFGEKAVGAITITIDDIFDLTKDLNTLKSVYNAALIKQSNMFRDSYIKLLTKHPRLSINVMFATKGDTININYKVINKSNQLKKKLEILFAGCTVNIKMNGARELLEIYRTEKSYTLNLPYEESYITRGKDDYVIISKLTDYMSFVTDERGILRKYLFESNVRDYLGTSEINKEIEETLNRRDGLDFWWLNNGVTILSSKATIASGKSIALEDVQIVNGLQTTTKIYEYLKTKNEKDESRALLIRIIDINDKAARDRIIKATNFQNPIPAYSLRATDDIQRDIEDYFAGKGWFYERRKNYYKNNGKRRDFIISIPYLAQAIMAIILKRPNDARARPSSLIKKDSDYAQVFDRNINLETMWCCARLMKLCDLFIKSIVDEKERRESNELRFHGAMVAAMKIMGKIKYSINDYSESAMSDEVEVVLHITESIAYAVEMKNKFISNNGWGMDRVVKSKEFVEYMIKVLPLMIKF